MWVVIFSDFVLLNVVIYLFSKVNRDLALMEWGQMRMFYIISAWCRLRMC